MLENSIDATVTALRQAKSHLANVREKFNNNEFLLSVYEPSAQELVRRYECELAQIIEEQADVKLAIEPQNNPVDVWVRIEGERFGGGKGPIGVIGSYLQRLNAACQHAMGLLEDASHQKNDTYLPVFDLVQTASGSLRLGLRHSVVDITYDPLFQEDLWDKFKDIALQNERTTKALMLLLRAISSTRSQHEFEELRNEMQNNEELLLRLLNYAKEITPSSQSLIERISFECHQKEVCGEKNAITIDKCTRRTINIQAKALRQGKEYVRASGMIRAQDIDNQKLFARPLRVGKVVTESVECRVPQHLAGNVFLNQLVLITGFLTRDTYGNPVKIDVDTLSVLDDATDDDI